MDNNIYIYQNNNHASKSVCENEDTPFVQARIETYFDSCVPFLRYCHNNGLIYISDLENLDFDSLADVRGIGRGKVEKLKSLYNDVCKKLKSSSLNEQETMMDSSKFPFKGIHSSNKRLSIIVLKHWTHSSKITRSLYDNGYTTLGELEDISENEFIRLLGKINIDKICAAGRIFTIPLGTLTDQLFDILADDKNMDIYELRADGCRLQDIGDIYDLTRERIRQICAKMENNILPFVELLAKEIEEDTGHIYVSDDQFMGLFTNESHAKMAFFALTNSEVYDYLDFADLLVEKTACPNVEDRLSRLLEEIVGDGINLFDNLELIEKSLADAGFDFITADDFLNLMIKKHYHFYGDNVLKSKKSYGLLCAEVVADEFPDGIIASDENLNNLRKLTLNKYPGIELPESNHALITRLANFLVLRGRSEYISPKGVFIEKDVLREIKQFIDLHSLNSLYYAEIFSEFEGLLTMTSNIDNAQFLHGVLVFYFPGEYTYTRDYLTKRSAQENKSLTERIEDLIFSSKGALQKKEILNKFPGITDTMLFNACLNSQKLIQWENNCYNTMENIIFSEGELENLKRMLIFLTDSNDGYCSEGLFFQVAKKDMPDSLARNKIGCAQNLFYTAMALFQNEFEFRRPHIARYGRFNPMNSKEIANTLMGNPDVLDASMFFKMANTLLWSPVTSGGIFSEIELDYIRISKDIYLKKENFALSCDSIDYVKDLLEQAAADSWYLSLQQFSASNTTLPDGLDFNEFLAESIVNQADLSWHIVSPRAKDRRFEKGILVRDSVDIFFYDALVAKILYDAGITELSESQLLDFLQIHQLARKVIPKELYVSDYFSVECEIFYVKNV